MRPEIRRQLNAINHEFYRITADAFDQTRSQPWEGWTRLLEYLPPVQDGFHILDVGCGNGRFGVFLAEQYPQTILTYYGIDSSTELLTRAETALEAYAPRVTSTLEQHDFIEAGPPKASGQYDLVVLFGVLHHIPGFDQRREFIADLAERVRRGGMLAFTAWRFYEFERFRSRIIPWPPELADEIEPHDYLLDWRRGEQAVRYCHYVDEHELGMLTTALHKPLLRYVADGQDQFNSYSVFRNF